MQTLETGNPCSVKVSNQSKNPADKAPPRTRGDVMRGVTEHLSRKSDDFLEALLIQLKAESGQDHTGPTAAKITEVTVSKQPKPKVDGGNGHKSTVKEQILQFFEQLDPAAKIAIRLYQEIATAASGVTGSALLRDVDTAIQVEDMTTTHEPHQYSRLMGMAEALELINSQR